MQQHIKLVGCPMSFGLSLSFQTDRVCPRLQGGLLSVDMSTISERTGRSQAQISQENSTDPDYDAPD